jgi:hypothetical protein
MPRNLNEIVHRGIHLLWAQQLPVTNRDKCSKPGSRNVEDCPVGRDSVAAVQVPSERIAINIQIIEYIDPRKLLSCIQHESTRIRLRLTGARGSQRNVVYLG